MMDRVGGVDGSACRRLCGTEVGEPVARAPAPGLAAAAAARACALGRIEAGGAAEVNELKATKAE